MGEENEVSAAEDTQAEETNVESQDQGQQEEQTVPLKALQAERKKRQEAEYQNKWYQDQVAQYQQNIQNAFSKQSEDDDVLITKKDLSNLTAEQQRVIERNVLETSFKQQHPDLENRIETELSEILQKKPWLAAAIQVSSNRYATAWEIMEDYKPKSDSKVKRKIEDNAMKPGSPNATTRGMGPKDYMRMSKSEFREFRKSQVAKR